MTNYKFLLTIILHLICLSSFSQEELEVKSLRMVSEDISGSQEIVNDNNDMPCAVLKVLFPESGLKIAGNVIGSALTNGKEYVVNLASGTKRITLVKKGIPPLSVNFNDHGVNFLKQKACYELVLNKIIRSNEVSGEIGGHEYVDLGLSVKWATYNIGASKIGEPGKKYKFGETVEYNENRPYTYMEDEWYNWDEIEKLKPRNDVANVKWGKPWRMPTNKEWAELTSNCKRIWTVKEGVPGALFIAKNGNKIFFPVKELEGQRGTKDQWLNYWLADGYVNDYKFSMIGYLGTNGLGKVWPSSPYNIRAVSDVPKIPDTWLYEYTLKPDGYSSGHAYVDLGLSVKWATTNIGAKFSHDIGEKSEVATCKWEGNWRIPTKEEIDEIIKKCTWIWTYNYQNSGASGYIIISNIPGHTDKSIFLPFDEKEYRDNYVTGYWTNSTNRIFNNEMNRYEQHPSVLCFDEDVYHIYQRTFHAINEQTYISMPIRPVIK